jgi:cation diffusion facilitator family transporter
MSSDENYRLGIRVTVVGALANLALSAIKLLAGIFGNSAAMISDALHSLSDLATDAVVLFSLRVAAIPKDENHPYGHGKVENFAAVGIGVMLIGVAIFMFFSGIDALIDGRETHPNSLALAAAAISIAVKEWLYHYTAKAGRKSGQLSLVANAWHHRTDALSSIAAMIGVGGAMAGAPFLDQIAAVVVAIFIVQAGAKIAWEGFGDLIDRALEPEAVKAIEKVICDTPGVVGFHQLRTRRVGSNIHVDVHIQLPADQTVAESHRIAGIVKSNILASHRSVLEVLVHVEPDTGCSLRPCMDLSDRVRGRETPSGPVNDQR